LKLTFKQNPWQNSRKEEQVKPKKQEKYKEQKSMIFKRKII
jgi:hypothetical protein